MANVTKNIRLSAFDKIIANNHAISVMLQENEDLYKRLESKKVDVPKDKDLIKFPVGRINRLVEFEEPFHLPEIINRENTMKNVEYNLQICSLYEYLTSRFAFYGSIETMLYMDWFIRLVSVIEAMIDNSAQYLGIDELLKEKQKKNEIERLITARDRMNHKNYKTNVGFSSELHKLLNDLYDQRNKIHLDKTNGDNSGKLKFTLEDVKLAEYALRELTELIYQNVY